MWKFLFAVIFLSVDAQRLKLNLGENIREGIEISDMNNVELYQTAAITYRLPNDTQPELYLINLNFGNFHEGDMEFTGNVLITIRVAQNTDTITLHSSVLVIDFSLSSDTNVPIRHDSVDYDSEREFMIIKTSENLVKDQLVRLTINYRGTIGTSISGVYRGSYLNNLNERRYLQSTLFFCINSTFYYARHRFFLATHMQPTFFRRICPGYDEPQFKAVFSLVLRYNSLFKSISNMQSDFSTVE